MTAKSFTSRASRRLALWGFDPRGTLSALRGAAVVRREAREFARQRSLSREAHAFPSGAAYPVYRDRYDTAGVASGHYFHQDLLVAREVFKRRPERHVDVGSSIYGFVSHVASFREIDVLDVRPVTVSVPGITFIQCDVMSLDHTFDGSTDSLSCLHALEHFGLGRYGDPIDYEGWRKGLSSLTRMLTQGGTLYLSVPTGEVQRVEFNAHRVFALPFLRDVLLAEYDIERLAFVTDAGELVPSVDPHSAEAEVSLHADYGCSIWILRKR